MRGFFSRAFFLAWNLIWEGGVWLPEFPGRELEMARATEKKAAGTDAEVMGRDASVWSGLVSLPRTFSVMDTVYKTCGCAAERYPCIVLRRIRVSCGSTPVWVD